nr:hypothetical protein [uncultured Actinoplanes sp.]
MPSNRLWGLGALAVIDVLLGLATNIIANAIGKVGASVVAGTLILAIIVMFGRLMGQAGHRTLLFSVIGAVLLFAVAARNAPREKVRDVSTTSSSPAAVPPSPAPERLSLSQYLDRWRNGPVKIDVEHYNSWVQRATEDDEIDETVLDLRVGIRNESTEGIDLSTAPGSLVLLMNRSFDPGTYAVDQHRVAEVPPDWYLFAVGFDNDDNAITVNGKDHRIAWCGGPLGVGEEFSSSSPAENGVVFSVPPPATETASENDAVPPRAAHVLGLAWLDTDGTIRGYAPIEKWAGPNTIASFLHA